MRAPWYGEGIVKSLPTGWWTSGLFRSSILNFGKFKPAVVMTIKSRPAPAWILEEKTSLHGCCCEWWRWVGKSCSTGCISHHQPMTRNPSIGVLTFLNCRSQLSKARCRTCRTWTFADSCRWHDCQWWLLAFNGQWWMNISSGIYIYIYIYIYRYRYIYI